MRILRILLLLVLVIIVFAGCGGPNSSSYFVQVTISVVDAVTNSAISSANTTMENGPVGQTSNGVTIFMNVQGDKDYKITTSAAGYTSISQSIHVGQSNLTMSVQMSKIMGTISGITVDDSSQAVSGVTAKIIELSKIVVSDESGQFNFKDIPVTDQVYSIEFLKSGYMPRTMTNIIFPSGNNNINLGSIIMSNSPGTISGRVTDLNGQAVYNACVKVQETNQTATADGNGDYTLQILPGTYTLVFSDARFVTYTKSDVVVTANKSTVVNASLSPKPGTISGICVNASNIHLSGITVKIISTGTSTITDSSGYFKFDSVTPGNYTLEFSNPSYQTLTQTVTVQNGKDLIIGNIQMTAKVGALSGRVINIDNGTPVPSATIRIIELNVSAPSDSNGYFSFTGVRIGTYTIEGTAANYSTARTNNIVIVENQTTNMPDLRLSSSPGSLAGICRNSAGSPLAGVSVTIMELTGFSVLTDSSGAFTISSVQPGTYTIKFSLANYSDLIEQSVKINSNQITNMGIVTIFPIPGSVSGKSTAGASVVLRGSSYSTTVNSSGAFAITNINPGNYTLDISLTNHTPVSLNISVSPNQNTDTGDNPLTAIPGQITGNTNASTVLIVQLERSAQVTNGSFQFTNVIPGTYTLRYTRSNYQSKDIIVTVNPNAITSAGQVDLTPTNGTIKGYINSSGCTVTLVEINNSQYFGSAAYFQFENLQPRDYHLKIEKPGFLSKIIVVSLQPGQINDQGTVNPSTTQVPWAGNHTQNEVLNWVSNKGYFSLNISQTVSYQITQSYGGSLTASIYSESGSQLASNTSYNPSGPITVGVTHNCSPGTYYVTGGNSTNSTFYAYNDVKGPSISLNKTCGFNLNSITVTINASDSVSGVDYLGYAFAPTTSTPINFNTIVSGGIATINEPGEWYLHIKTWDGSTSHNATNYYEGPFLIGSGYAVQFQSSMMEYAGLFNEQKSPEASFTGSPLAALRSPEPNSETKKYPIGEASVGLLIGSLALTARKRRKI